MKTIDDFKRENILIQDFNDYVSMFKCPVITIYDKNTIDYKGFNVARLFECKEGRTYPTKLVCVNEDIEKIKEAIPEYMHFFIRSEDDDKCIIGAYI